MLARLKALIASEVVMRSAACSRDCATPLDHQSDCAPLCVDRLFQARQVAYVRHHLLRGKGRRYKRVLPTRFVDSFFLVAASYIGGMHRWRVSIDGQRRGRPLGSVMAPDVAAARQKAIDRMLSHGIWSTCGTIV